MAITPRCFYGTLAEAQAYADSVGGNIISGPFPTRPDCDTWCIGTGTGTATSVEPPPPPAGGCGHCGSTHPDEYFVRFGVVTNTSECFDCDTALSGKTVKLRRDNPEAHGFPSTYCLWISDLLNPMLCRRAGASGPYTSTARLALLFVPGVSGASGSWVMYVWTYPDGGAPYDIRVDYFSVSDLNFVCSGITRLYYGNPQSGAVCRFPAYVELHP